MPEYKPEIKQAEYRKGDIKGEEQRPPYETHKHAEKGEGRYPYYYPYMYPPMYEPYHRPDIGSEPN